MRLGMHFDLWSIQNAFWAAVRGGTWRHDDEALARLAQALWFDETIVLARVAGNRERASA
jgi:hypothetical protein